jgi:hypothetical protein
MSTSQAPQAQSPVPVSSAPVVLRIILAILLLIPGMMGIIVLGGLTGLWIYEGFAFAGPDRPWMPLFILPAVGFILLSVAPLWCWRSLLQWRWSSAIN